MLQSLSAGFTREMSEVAIILPGMVSGLSELHCKKSLAVFPSPAGMSHTKLSLDGTNLNISLVSDIPAGDGKTANIFTVYRRHNTAATVVTTE
jgi:hypothetical protein